MQANASDTRETLLEELRRLYAQHGCEALSTPFLEKEKLYMRLRKVGLKQADCLAELGLEIPFAAWKAANRRYAGQPQQLWSWERVLETARQAISVHGALPAMEWFRKNGQTGLVNAVFRTGHSWELLREAVGDFKQSSFRQSRNGMRWLSQPETSMSDFLFARGVPHTKGRRYDPAYGASAGRRHGTYDLHFLSQQGIWIDVEIWGDLPDNLSGGKYAATRALKEQWNADNPNFLGIQYQDCLSDARLTEILAPYIGVIAPFNFTQPSDHQIETAHWTDGNELLETCRQIAAMMPDRLFPNEQWLRKRGKYAGRPGEAYNSVALRVNQWLGGTRNVRKLLGQEQASTRQWSATAAIEAWRKFEADHGVPPTTLASKDAVAKYPTELIRQANMIRAAATRHGVLDVAREGKKGRAPQWSEAAIRQAWDAFEQQHGFPPSKAVGTKRRAQYSAEIGNAAARIYQAARKNGLLPELRGQAPRLANQTQGPA